MQKLYKRRSAVDIGRAHFMAMLITVVVANDLNGDFSRYITRIVNAIISLSINETKHNPTDVCW